MDCLPYRVWFVHDWLTGMRGGEKVLLELVRLLPNSRIATLLHVPGTTHPELDARVARTSFLQNMPGAVKHYRHYLPLFPLAAKSMPLDGECDVVISVSHAVAKGVPAPRGVPHYSFCLTPMRYIWGFEDHYLAAGKSLKRTLLNLVKPRLRRFDLASNANVTEFLTQSENIRKRIRDTYNRECAAIINPGIDEAMYTPPAGAKGEKSPQEFPYYLMAGALVGYKRADLAVRAFSTEPALKDKHLVIIGKGPEEKEARAMAGPNVHMLGWQSDAVVVEHYRHCAAFLFPGEEDYGLTPLEAQACGRPVIAYGRGGVLETVVDGETGVFFDEQTAGALAAAIMKFEGMGFDAERAREQAEKFTWGRFAEGWRGFLESRLGRRGGNGEW